MTDEQRYTIQYHMDEMKLRRDRQTSFFTWSTSLMMTLTTLALIGHVNGALDRVGSYLIAAMLALLGAFAFDQMRHDRRVAILHWGEVAQIHKQIAGVSGFSDRQAKLVRRLRPQLFVLLLAGLLIGAVLAIGHQPEITG